MKLLLEILKASEQNTQGSASNKARTVQEKYDALKAEHEKLKSEYKKFKKIQTNTMFTPQERLKMIMAKNKPRRTGKSNWKRLSVANKLRAGLKNGAGVKKEVLLSSGIDHINNSNVALDVSNTTKIAKKKRLKPIKKKTKSKTK